MSADTIPVHTADLATLRDLITRACTDQALALLDSITSAAPVTRIDAASTKQTYFLFRLTGHDVRGWNLTRAEASDMLDALLTTGEAMHGDTRLITSATGDKIRGLNKRKSSIPF
jgi:hypothetical protein